MIARVWHGKTARADRAAYLGFVKKTATKEFGRLKGSRGFFILTRDSEGSTEFMVIPLWDSMKALKEFTKEPKKPVYYAQDSEYLLSLTSVVKHYRVAAKL